MIYLQLAVAQPSGAPTFARAHTPRRLSITTLAIGRHASEVYAKERQLKRQYHSQKEQKQLCVGNPVVKLLLW